MQDSKLLIQRTKKKFILYSLAGILLVALVSFLGLKYHNQTVRQQESIQVLYSMLFKQYNLVNKIARLGEKFTEYLGVEEKTRIRREFEENVNALQTENRDFNKWLRNNDFTPVNTIEELIKEQELDSNLLEYLKRARELADSGPNARRQIRKDIKYLSTNSRYGLSEIFEHINNSIVLEQKRSLEKLNQTGILLVALCVLQVILVWLLVFRPLYSTITIQHERICDALLRANSASRSKTDFLANISHEIRTPMTAILGYADFLKKEDISKGEKEDFIKIINQNASHLLDLIDEILDISKIEAGKVDFEFEKVNLSTLLNEVYSLIHVKSKDKGIELVFKNKGKIPEAIEADPKRFKQILFNILGNAIKFTEKGYVELVVAYCPESRKISIRVKDTGKGISLEQSKKLFRPFEQIDSSVSREYGGTGLGLVLSRGLARGMGGDIKMVDSKVGVGTEFEITLGVGSVEDLKLVSSFSTGVARSATDSFISWPLLRNTKILVVEDAKENARLFKMYLTEAGAKVEVAHNGEQALDLATQCYFDLVLLDIQMPGKDGFQVIKELREKSFTRPVVALTAHAMKEERAKTRDAGFDDHITKPVRPDDLIRSVSTLIHDVPIRSF